MLSRERLSARPGFILVSESIADGFFCGHPQVIMKIAAHEAALILFSKLTASIEIALLYQIKVNEFNIK